jgi:Bacterial Ig-like domain (group 2)
MKSLTVSRSLLILIFIAAHLLTATVVKAAQKSKATVPVDIQKLKIVAPKDGAIVNPGQVIHVVVVPIGVLDLKRVVVMGNEPFGIIQSAVGPPFYLDVPVPKKYISAGLKYKLTAQGAGPSQSHGYSLPVMIDVEEAGPPRSLVSRPRSIELRRAVDHMRLHIIGKFADNPFFEMTESTKITYVSAAPAIATVSKTGVVTAVAPGSTTITATSDKISTIIPVKIFEAVVLKATPVKSAASSKEASKKSNR